MSLRVKKELERIYDGLLSVTAVCLCRVKKTGELVASKGMACAEGVQAAAGVLYAERRDAGRSSINAANINIRNANARQSQSPFTILRKFFGSKPLSARIANSLAPANSLPELKPLALHHESVLDASIRVVTAVPFSAWRKRLVWVAKTGLDTPCATVNLARDALDESIIFCASRIRDGSMVLT